MPTLVSPQDHIDRIKVAAVRLGCHGAAFEINGKIAGLDLFDKPAALAKLWSKLIKSYAMDALEEPNEKPHRLMDEIATGNFLDRYNIVSESGLYDAARRVDNYSQHFQRMEKACDGHTLSTSEASLHTLRQRLSH